MTRIMNSIILIHRNYVAEISFDVFLYSKPGSDICLIYNFKEFLEIHIYNTRFIENILILL